MNVITSIVAKLGLNTLEWEAGSRKAQKEMRDLQKSMADFATKGKVVGLTIAGMTAAVAAWADELTDTASAADMTVNTVLKVGTALSQAGGEAKNSGRMISEFVKTIGEAADGSKTAQETFKKLGIGISELKTLDNEQLFARAVEQLAAIPDAATRSSRAFELFGKSARGVNFKEFANELKNAKNLTADQEAGLSDAAASVDQFSLAIKKLYLTGAEYLGPLAKGFTEFLLDVVTAIDKVVHGIEDMIKGIGDLMKSIPRLPATQGDEYDSATSGFIDTGTGEVVRTRKIAQANKLNELKAGFSGRNVTPAKGEKDKELNDLLSIYRVSDELAAKYENTIGNINQRTSEMLMLTQEQVEITRTLNDIENQRVETIGKLEVKYKEAQEKGASNKVLDSITAEINEVNRLADTYKSAAEAAKQAEYERRMSADAGWAESMRKYQEMSINMSDAVSQSVDSMFNNMTNAIMTFVETGKLSFSDFARAVILDIARIETRMAVAGLIKMGIGAISAGFSGGTTPGLSSSNTYQGPPTASVAASMGTRAGGGDVSAGNAYVVGEKGPELFYPQSDGVIQPNGGGSKGGTVVNINNYIQALDANSFDQKVLATISNNCKSAFAAIKQGELQMGAVSFS